MVAEPPTPDQDAAGARRRPPRRAARRCRPWTAPIGSLPSAPADQRQARGPGHLDHGRAPGEAPRRPRPARPAGRSRSWCGWGRRGRRACPRPRRPPAPRRRANPRPRPRARRRPPPRGAVAVPRILSGAATTARAASSAGRTRTAAACAHRRAVGRPAGSLAACVDRAAVIVSNRGPLSFQQDDDGGLVGPPRRRRARVRASAPLVAGTDTLWVAAAMSDGDREAAAAGRRRRRGLPGPPARHRPRDLPPRLRRGQQPGRCGSCTTASTTCPASRPSAPAWPTPGRPTATVNRAFADAVAEVAPAGRGRAGAGLPPGAAWASTSAEHRPDLRRRPLQPHPVRHPDVAAGAARPRGRRGLLAGWPPTAPAASTPRRWAADFAACVPRRAGADAPHVRVAAAGRPPTTCGRSPPRPPATAALAELDEPVGDRAA